MAQGGLDPIASRSAAEVHLRQSIPFGTAHVKSVLAVTRVGKGAHASAFACEGASVARRADASSGRWHRGDVGTALALFARRDHDFGPRLCPSYAAPTR